MNVLIACGPTREYIDAVRFISNASSGRMGRALTLEAAARGHSVRVVHGPVEVKFPQKVESFPVINALQMRDAVLAHFEWADVVLMAAAVADWRPEKTAAGKLKKSAGPPSINFVKNPDILAELGQNKTRQVLVGFALETENLAENAAAKLHAKNADLFVANSPKAVGSVKSLVHILDKSGKEIKAGPASKRKIAAVILDAAEGLAP